MRFNPVSRQSPRHSRGYPQILQKCENFGDYQSFNNFSGRLIALLSSCIENRVDVGFADVCADRNQNEKMVPRSKEAIPHRVRRLLAKTIRESLGKFRKPSF
jgi:hypothetical protein